MFYNDEKIAIFIDGANLYAAAKSLDFDIDYRLLLKWAREHARLLRAFYYTILPEDQEYSPLRPLVDWLGYNGFTMVTKPAREYTDQSGRRKMKSSIDLELAIDMLETAPHVDHILLFAGDSDFRRLVETVQRQGVRVTVISTIQAGSSLIADDLRRQADRFYDLDSLAPHILREPVSIPQQSTTGELV